MQSGAGESVQHDTECFLFLFLFFTRVVVAISTIKNSENATTGDYSAPSKHSSSDYGPDSQFTGASDNQDVRSITVN